MLSRRIKLTYHFHAPNCSLFYYKTFGMEHTCAIGLVVANIDLNSPKVPILTKCDMTLVVKTNSILSDKNITDALTTLNYLNFTVYVNIN